MTRISGQLLLKDLVTTLVANFGEERVQQALSKAINKSEGSSKSIRTANQARATNSRATQPSVLDELEKLLSIDPDKHRIISNFYEALKSRETLPDPQDIRHFAQLIGIKRISGKSRKDMIAPLVRFLIGQSSADLEAQIDRATNVSERQRQQGFSVLTDKLLGN